MGTIETETTFEPIKTDSKIFEFVEATGSTKKSIWNELKSGFYKRYFPNQFPGCFERDRQSDDFGRQQTGIDLSTTAKNSLDINAWTYDIACIKSLTKSFTMKIVHPTKYKDLIIHLWKEEAVLKSNDLKDAMNGIKNKVHVFENDNMLNDKRIELIEGSGYKYVSRFDVRDYFPKFYTHFTACLKTDDVYCARQAFDNNTQSEWARSLDKAISACQHNETHGLPISGDLFHFIANIVSIFIDHRVVKNFKNINGKYEILRYQDNYDIFTKTTEQSEIVMNAFVQVYFEFQLDLNIYMNCNTIDKECFKLLKELDHMNTTSLLRELDASMNDPDYHLMVARVSGKFLARIIHETQYQNHLDALLTRHPLCIKEMVSLSINSKNKMNPDLMECMADSLLSAMETSPFKAIVSTQWLNVLQYFYKMEIKGNSMKRLTRLIHKYHLDKDLFIREYFQLLHVDCKASPCQTQAIDQYELSDSTNWLKLEISKCITS